MKNVLIKNSLFILCLLILLGCDLNKRKNEKIKGPLILDITFKEFGNITLAYDKNKKEIDTNIWRGHERDSIIFFKINLKNLKAKPFFVKIHLVANKIPFLIKYTKGKDDKIILEIIQQFNTVYSDSLIFERHNLDLFLNAPSVFQIFNNSYQHDGTNTKNKTNPKYIMDTIDISKSESMLATRKFSCDNANKVDTIYVNR